MDKKELYLRKLVHNEIKKSLNEVMMGMDSFDQIKRELANVKLPLMDKILKSANEELLVKVETIITKEYNNFIKNVLLALKPLKKEIDSHFEGRFGE